MGGLFWTVNLFVSAVFSILNPLTVVATDEPNIVEIKQGKLRGLQDTSRNGQTFYAFLGIPFVDKPDRFEVKS